MAGIYLHIPFCKQACHYCDFHFSTSVKKKSAMVSAICSELELRKSENFEAVETIYFGGGTPSLLSEEELHQIFQTIYEHYPVSKNAEITFEANPDDLTEEKIQWLARHPVNRLSIGVQSFRGRDLELMNRAHNQKEAIDSIRTSKKYFDNISIDLIYGIPGMDEEAWSENLKIALELDVPHISSYALTVEPRTALKSMIEKGKIAPVEEDLSKEHYDTMLKTLESHGYVNYEFSNFGKPRYFSRNNTAYWFGKPYIGIGPSAHSFDGNVRTWNVSNNSLYIKALERRELPSEKELLSGTDRYNEYVMTRLRTMWGISILEVEGTFGTDLKNYMMKEARNLIDRGMLEEKDGVLKVSEAGKFLSDGIAANLFYIPLEGDFEGGEKIKNQE